MTEMDMSILNGNQWTREDGKQVKARGEHSYQKIRRDGVHKSYIDVGYADKDALKHINRFEILGFEAHIPNSDHAPLIMNIGMNGNKPETVETEQKDTTGKTNWESFSKVLESRLIGKEQEFLEGSVGHQFEILSNNITAAFHSTTTEKVTRRRKPRKSEKRKSISTKLRKIIIKKKECLQALKAKMEQAQDYTAEKDAYLQLRNEELIEQIKCETNRKFKLRQICRGKSPNAVRMFWSCIKGTKPGMPKLPVIQVREGVLSSCPSDRKNALDSHLKSKFKTSYEMNLGGLDDIDPQIFTSKRKFSEETAIQIELPFTEEELETCLSELTEGKAPGLDGITPTMLKNIPPKAKEMIKILFNNIQISGTVPKKWKDGKVVMLLKKNPGSIMTNYRPITLISVISKVYTKLLNKRITKAILEEDILGPEQNGFRPSRACNDNLFILNTVIEKYKQNDNLQLCFVDISSAYDSVNRSILWKRLEEVNIPESVIKFLKNYYSNDNITCKMGSIQSEKHYQTRGLRQGCNLSPSLFSIYLMDLSHRLTSSETGPSVTGIIINNLLFADDLVLLADSALCMQKLISILSIWARDFKMKISADKSKIITGQNRVWKYYSYEEEMFIGLDQVDSHKYLGVKITRKLKETSEQFVKELKTRATTYANAILRIKNFDLDRIETSLELWKMMAVPRFLYGIEVIPTLKGDIDRIAAIQNKMARALLGVKGSTANVFNSIELGIKPLQFIVYKKKLAYYHRVNSENFIGSDLVKTCMKYHKENTTSAYMSEIKAIMDHMDLDPAEPWRTAFKRWEKSETIDDLNFMKSLIGVSRPKAWWKPASYLDGSEEAHLIANVRGGNAEIGNRDNSMAAFDNRNIKGQTKICRLCKENAWLSEMHVILTCQAMKDTRAQIQYKGTTYLKWIVEALSTTNTVEVYKKLLNPDIPRKLDKTELADLLGTMLIEYKLKWLNLPH